ncbi:MAG: ATP-binding cassette domain-containing protein [Acidimicrobiales bacterium]
MPTSTIILDDVSRSFGSVTALHGASIAAPQGRITVLLGPNGAGKTTAIRLITGALAPDGGTVRVFGTDPTSDDGEDVRRRCGVVSAKPSLYDRLSGRDNLRYAAELYGLGRGATAGARLVAAAEQFDIAGSLDAQVAGYSTGMKTRLALARAVLHEPELLLLDEPTSGLDPESAAAVLALIRTMAGDGRTVLMCTHLLLEAEGLADEVVIMHHGTTITSGRPDDLAAEFWPHPIVSFTATDGAGLDGVAVAEGVVDYDRDRLTARLTLDGQGRVPELIHALVVAGVQLTAVEPYRPTLEDLYFAVQLRQRERSPAPARPVLVGAS